MWNKSTKYILLFRRWR